MQCVVIIKSTGMVVAFLRFCAWKKKKKFFLKKQTSHEDLSQNAQCNHVIMEKLV